MRFTPQTPPRRFQTGLAGQVTISDCGRLTLDADEMVSFVTGAGAEYDVVRKSWGFYATPSLNGRLRGFGLRAALVRNSHDRYYVFLVEAGREADLDAYLRAEDNRIVRWLDNDADLAAAAGAAAATATRCVCESTQLTREHVYDAPPAGEVPRLRTADGGYRREIYRCPVCGHFVSTHAMEAPSFYEGAYMDATYGDSAGIRRTFERITSLPPERSDNAGRVARVLEFARRRLPSRDGAPSVLDVGSGLCVFLHGMKTASWACTALDPDPRAAAHARDVVGVAAVAADFMTAADLGRHDVVTFNKVLEHVADPVAMLQRAAGLVHPSGFVYVEVPDGEMARTDADGFGREEFFIEHLHAFSAASLAIVAARSGFAVAAIERLREPSSKYTLCAFLTP